MAELLPVVRAFGLPCHSTTFQAVQSFPRSLFEKDQPKLALQNDLAMSFRKQELAMVVVLV